MKRAKLGYLIGFLLSGLFSSTFSGPFELISSINNIQVNMKVGVTIQKTPSSKEYMHQDINYLNIKSDDKTFILQFYPQTHNDITTVHNSVPSLLENSFSLLVNRFNHDISFSSPTNYKAIKYRKSFKVDYTSTQSTGKLRLNIRNTIYHDISNPVNPEVPNYRGVFLCSLAQAFYMFESTPFGLVEIRQNLNYKYPYFNFNKYGII